MTNIQELLDVAGSDPNASAWAELYQEVCHQGDCYAEGFFLVPLLAEIATGFGPADRDNVLIFAGQIAVDLDEGSRERYDEALILLRRAADEWLLTPTDTQTFVYRLQAVVALEGDKVWGKNLDGIVDEEYEVECPICATSLFVAIGERGHFASHEDYVTKPEVERNLLSSAEPAQMGDLGLRLHRMSVEAGQEAVADALAFVFGDACCTVCGTVFRVADQVGKR